MRDARVWRALVGVEKAVVEDIEFEQADGDAAGERLLVARVRVTRATRHRYGVCRRRCGGYDAGEGRRRWRALDLGTVQVVLEADAARVSCREHGVVVAHVPWAGHGAGHTHRVDAHRLAHGRGDHRPGLGRRGEAGRPPGRVTRVGIDEISYKRGHRYITVVVDHDSGRLLWAAPGRDRATLRTFFDLLGPQRCAASTRSRRRRSGRRRADPGAPPAAVHRTGPGDATPGRRSDHRRRQPHRPARRRPRHAGPHPCSTRCYDK